jgi:uncharacterized protein YfkK (UPF0435 family)
MKNKRNKFTKLLKIGILLFTVSLSLWNCEKDPIIEHAHQSINSTSTFSRTLINDLIETDKTFSKLSENYLVDKLKKRNSSLKNTSNNLIITSDTVSVVEKENYKSYTIRIKRSGEEYDTENLVIEEKDGIKSAYILSYLFDNQWVVNRLKGIHNPPKGKIYYSKYDISNLTSKTTTLSKAGSCSYVTISIIAPCSCGDYYISQCSGCSYGQKYPTSYTTSQLVCDSGGGSENDFGSPLPTNGNGPVTGGGGGPSASSNNSQTQANLESMAEFIEFKLNRLVIELKLDTNQTEWVSKHTKEALDIYDFVAKKNNWSLKAKNFAKQAIALERTLEKPLQVKQTGSHPEEISDCCPGSCCPNESFYENDKIIKEYGVQPIQAAVDGAFNLLSSTIDLVASEKWVGEKVRRIMTEIGMDVPTDVSNEHLAAIFKIRKRNGLVIVEYKEGILKEMLDLGLNSLDMISFLSPSKGGGAFLASKIGGISITKMTQHLRKISINNTKINNVISKLNPKAKFDLAGTEQYKTVAGHHPLAKSALKGDKFYKWKEAFTVSANSLGGQAVHNAITGNQNRLYSAFAKKGEVLTIDKMADIEIQAMFDAGIPKDIATGWVIKALQDLKDQGVKIITHIPWNGVN